MSSIWTVRRSATDAKLTGLCGGLARHWGVDPVLIRVGCVLLALSGGIGLVLYLAGWLLIPADGRENAPLQDVLGEQAGRWPREAWIAIVAVCCMLTFAVLKPVAPFGLGPAVVLALIWYFGYYRHRSAQPGPAGALSAPADAPVQVPAPPQFFSYPGPPTPFTEAATAWQRRVEEAHRGESAAIYRGIYDRAPDPDDLREPEGPAASLPLAQPLGAESAAFNEFLAVPDPAGLYVDPGTPVVATRAAPPQRSASRSARRLRLVALLTVGLTLFGLGLADGLGVKVPTAAYFASTLLILGLTLVAATWFGRARGILPVAMLMLLATVGTTVGGPVAQHQGWGRAVAYTSVAQLASGDQQKLGRLRVDLTGLAPTADASYTAHVGMGDLEVTTPRSYNVVINWRVKSGAFVLDDQEPRGGSDQSGRVEPTPRDPRKKTLTLNLSVDHGVVQVRR